MTRQENTTDYYFGIEVKDPYRWLEDDRSVETSEWVKAQNKITEAYLSKIPFRNILKDRLKELNNYAKQGVPFIKNGHYFFFRNEGLQNQSILYYQHSPSEEAEILLDPNALSSDGTVALTTISISNDGKYLGYSIARNGSDWNEILVLDIERRETLSDRICWSKFSNIAWQDNGFYYSAYDAPTEGKEYSSQNQFHKIYFHEIGSLQSEDRLVYTNSANPFRNCTAVVSDDEYFLFISESESTSGNSLSFKNLKDETTPTIPLAIGFDYEYEFIDHIDNKLYILTNWKAPKQRLMEIDPQKPSIENWKEVLPEANEVLESVTIIDGTILAIYLKDAAHQAVAYNLEGIKRFEIELPGIGSLSGFSCNKKGAEAYYQFSSYSFPPTTYRLNVKENRSELYYQAQVAFQPNDYSSEQVFYTSKDGTKIPLTLTYKKGISKNGANPVMLYGYGGFNISLIPNFNVVIIPFLENGGIYAVANVRGGGEYGEEWHQAGTQLQKQNVFDDFIAAAEYLISEGYTCSKQLAINGRSNGGLLVGTCMTQRPDLFTVAIPEVGVLDMLRYHLFTIGWAWASDYGTSADDEKMFQYLKRYSPIHNIEKGNKHPATLVMTGDHDDRVVPAHSFKFAATLQKATQGTTPAFIRIDCNAGHGAGKPIDKTIAAQADLWSFVMHELGM
jgi:prolyl oligopeptidase